MGVMSSLVQQEAANPDLQVIDSKNGDAMLFSPEIPALYSRIRELVARSACETGLCVEIDRKIE